MMGGENLRPNRRDVRVSAYCHCRIKFCCDDFQAASHALLPACRWSIEGGPADHRAARPECHGFPDILAGPDITVGSHLDTPARRIHDSRQCLCRRNRAVELTPATIPKQQ
jgi:hypothetical protein